MKKIYFILPLLATVASCSVEHTVSAKPVVITYEPQNIQDTTVEIGGVVYNDAGSMVTERGIVISASSENPTVADTKALAGSGEGEFFGLYSDLEDNTTYHYRAFGTNASGTGYGEAFTFTTLPSICNPEHINLVDIGPAEIEVEHVIKENSWATYENGNVQFYVQQGNYVLTLQFNEAQQQLPQSAIFSTTQIFLNADTPSDRKVKVYLSDTGNPNSGHLAPDGEFVFIENNNGIITFTFCDTYVNPDYTLYGKFTYYN